MVPTVVPRSWGQRPHLAKGQGKTTWENNPTSRRPIHNLIGPSPFPMIYPWSSSSGRLCMVILRVLSIQIGILICSRLELIREPRRSDSFAGPEDVGLWNLKLSSVVILCGSNKSTADSPLVLASHWVHPRSITFDWARATGLPTAPASVNCA